MTSPSRLGPMPESEPSPDPEFACIICGGDARRGVADNLRRNHHHICLICSRRGFMSTFSGHVIRMVHEQVANADEMNASRAIAMWARSFAIHFNGGAR